MRLTVEQLRAGAAAAEVWAEVDRGRLVCDIPWKRPGTCGCPAHAMFLTDHYYRDLLSTGGLFDRDAIYLAMNELVSAAIFNDGVTYNCQVGNVMDALRLTLAAADLTERRAAEARARREEFEVPERAVAVSEVRDAVHA